MEFPKLQIKKLPKQNEKQTSEYRYWKRFKNAAVNCVDFCPTKPHNFAVGASTRVQIYSPQSNTVKKTISRFSNVVHDASFRNDGRLIVAADASGQVQVFDLNSRAILRTFDGHQGPARVSKFIPSTTQVLSAGNDKTVRVWDIPTQTQLHMWEDHADYVKCGAVSASSPHLVLSGSYDHTVKLYDLRTNSAVMSMTHSFGGSSFPVESVLMFPGDTVVLSAGGNSVLAWDILGGSSGRLLSATSNHQKTITCMAFDSNCSRIFTGSLDHHVKIYDVTNYKVVYSVKYPEPVLSVGVSPDETHLVAGMVSGLLSIREKKAAAATETVEESSENDIFRLKPKPAKMTRHEMDMNAKGGSYRFFLRGMYKPPSEEDIVVDQKKKPKLKAYEKHLKAFEYGAALDSVLTKDMNPLIVLTVLEDLKNRGDGLDIALSSRDDASLEPLMMFIFRHVMKPAYTDVLIHALDIIIDKYSSVAHSSPIVSHIMENIRKKTKNELRVQSDLQKIMGTLDMLMASADK